MRDYFCFRNAKEFQELFGYRNGTRKNKILLAFLKSKEVFRYDRRLMCTNSMPMLKQICLHEIGIACRHEDYRKSPNVLFLNGMAYFLKGYCTDEEMGVCTDGDNTAVRYEKDGSLYKMRAGKLFRKIILEDPFGRLLPEQVVTWLCEEFASDWQTYAANHRKSPYKLVTGLTDDLTFADIYGNSARYVSDNLGSCMTGRNRQDFYDKSVGDCYPAALVLERNPKKIVSRCVVFNNVKDVESGDVYRLAERQYSSIGEKGQRILVQELKNAGLIDGYKFIGASCHDSTNFVDINGNALNEKCFAIPCSFDDNKTLSYQDSFKYYIDEERLAYNKNLFVYDLDLGSTSERVNVRKDTYHNVNVFNSCVVNVWVDGEMLTCAERELDDFTYSFGAWYHTEKDTTHCPVCGCVMGKHHIPDSCKSEKLGKSYCSTKCASYAEKSILDVKQFFSVYDNDFVAKASELTSAFVYYYLGWRKSGYKKISIKRETLSVLTALGMARKYRGNMYVGLDRDGELITAFDGSLRML